MISLPQNLKRLLTGLIFGFPAIYLLILGGIWLMILLAVITLLALKEYVKILNTKGFYPLKTVSMIMTIVFIILVGFQRMDLIPAALTFAVILSFSGVLFKGRQPYIANVATTVFGIFYCGWLPCYFLLIRQFNIESLGLITFANNDGLGFIMLIFFAVLATDTGGYYIGTKFGKHKLCPVVSPKKTIEGAIGGAFFAIFITLGIGYLINLEWFHSIILSIIVTTFAQLGDLCESLIKRDAGVKDSSNILPGHGGFMDRADSYVLSAPVAYYYIKFFVLDNDLWLDFVEIVEKALHVFGIA